MTPRPPRQRGTADRRVGADDNLDDFLRESPRCAEFLRQFPDAECAWN